MLRRGDAAHLQRPLRVVVEHVARARVQRVQVHPGPARHGHLPAHPLGERRVHAPRHAGGRAGDPRRRGRAVYPGHHWYRRAGTYGDVALLCCGCGVGPCVAAACAVAVCMSGADACGCRRGDADVVVPRAWDCAGVPHLLVLRPRPGVHHSARPTVDGAGAPSTGHGSLRRGVVHPRDVPRAGHPTACDCPCGRGHNRRRHGDAPRVRNTTAAAPTCTPRRRGDVELLRVHVPEQQGVDAVLDVLDGAHGHEELGVPLVHLCQRDVQLQVRGVRRGHAARRHHVARGVVLRRDDGCRGRRRRGGGATQTRARGWYVRCCCGTTSGISRACVCCVVVKVAA